MNDYWDSVTQVSKHHITVHTVVFSTAAIFYLHNTRVIIRSGNEATNAMEVDGPLLLYYSIIQYYYVAYSNKRYTRLCDVKMAPCIVLIDRKEKLCLNHQFVFCASV